MTLTHFDAAGHAHMVDVAHKPPTDRMAIAEARVVMSAPTLALVLAGTAAKGDVLGVARLAGIMAAKRTSDLIPLCHPLPLTQASVDFEPDAALPGVRIRATVRTRGITGVEMEALTAATVAALTIYDMLKAAEKGMRIEEVRLLLKEGGKSGRYVASAPPGGDAMRLGYVTLEGRGRTDALIAEVAALLETDGLRLCGTVQSNPERPGRAKCDMDLRILPDGPVIRISEDRGNLARGCRLDSGALEQTVLEVQKRLDGADLLIVNKFGKREAEGHGLGCVIAEALERGMPVLVGVNALNLPAFDTFSGGLAQALPPDAKRIARWCRDR